MLHDLRADDVREMLDYDPASGILTWRNHKRLTFHKYLIGKRAGFLATTGRWAIRINGKIYYAHRIAWLHYYGKWPEYQLDHINVNPLDNRIENLREATGSQNQANSPLQSNNRSGYKGVSWFKRDKKWQAQIQWNKKSRCLGHFETREEAHAAYCAAAKEHYGEFARTA